MLYIISFNEDKQKWRVSTRAAGKLWVLLTADTRQECQEWVDRQ